MLNLESNTPERKYNICVVPPEQHYESFDELRADIKWYESSRAYFYKEHPQFAPPKDKFEKVKLANDKGFILLPTSMD